MSKTLSIIDGIVKGRFSLLLFSFILTFLVIPLIPAEQNFLDKSISVFGLVVLLSCLRAITQTRRVFFFIVGLWVIKFVVGGPQNEIPRV